MKGISKYHANVKRLRSELAIGLEEARRIAATIKGEGRTVDQYLASRREKIAAPSPVSSNGQAGGDPVELIKLAGDLLSLAGSKERALKAIEAFGELAKA